ncbi:MAG: CARDB domain-containing protein [Candidatus Aenigmarchaeota archaeon]|nr:CARDB domain-containing protein [Candidatus Aenigmarchaeota archaeon]
MKGISAVLATVLIVVITVAIIGLAYGWATGMFKMVSDTSEENVGKTTDNMMKSVQIIAAKCEDTLADNTNTVTFTIRSTGTKDIEAAELSAFLDEELQTVTFANLLAGTSDDFSFTTDKVGDLNLKVSAPAGAVDEDITCPVLTP